MQLFPFNIALLSLLFGLLPPVQQQFEVASVKRNFELGSISQEGGCHGIDVPEDSTRAAETPLGRCVFPRVLGYHLVTYAYGLENGPLPRNAMIQGVPDWFRTGIFEVNAKAEDPSSTTQDDLLEMLRNLLADRFKLRFHLQAKDVDGFRLLQRPGDKKLKIAADDEPRSVMIIPGKKPSVDGGKQSVSFRRIIARNYTISEFTTVLSSFTGGPIVDATDLADRYDFDLSWDTDMGPSLFTAVQEQLGLRLVPQKAPVQLFVIDFVEKPAGN